MKIKELITVTGANILRDINEDLEVNISTDTRTIEKGDFYLPLKGANFDGEKFISQALEKGAVGAFCTDNSGTLQVKNTLEAYLKLANYRRLMKNYTVVAVTGSSGKTTTKEIIASVLQTKYKTYKTPLNYNNEIGLCQTIFTTPEDAEVLVLEMGMRGLGEIELLSRYSQPDITVISNIGTAHIGRLGSRNNIAIAKCEIVKYQRGNIFIAHDDELIKKNIDFKGTKIFYSIKDVNILEQNANYSKFEYKENLFELNVGGYYNIENALSAINVGLSLNMSYKEIQEGLKSYRPIEKRWESVKIGKFELINDSYNANPESMRAFIDTIFEFYENPIIILGDMGELGENEIYYHKDLGRYINNHKLLKENIEIITIGNLSKNISNEIDKIYTQHFDNIQDVTNYIKQSIKEEHKIFLKASRSMKLEKIIENLSL